MTPVPLEEKQDSSQKHCLDIYHLFTAPLASVFLFSPLLTLPQALPLQLFLTNL